LAFTTSETDCLRSSPHSPPGPADPAPSRCVHCLLSQVYYHHSGLEISTTLIWDNPIEFTAGADRDIDDLPEEVRRAIGEAILALAEDPTPPGSIALAGTLKGSRRIRVRDYPVGYQVDRRGGVVTVWMAGHRGKLYEKAQRRAQRAR
jgi:mRNA interferase RelE/StbE